MTNTPQEITIRGLHDNETVGKFCAPVVSGLAVHRSLDGDRHDWRVTHAATGWTVGVRYLRTKRAATWARDQLLLLGDWAPEDVMPLVRAQVARIREIAQEARYK